MRYTGSKSKRCRATGLNLYGNDKFDYPSNSNRPGQHGAERRKLSDYAVRLLEKQKIKWYYGVTEKQLRSLYAEAQRKRTETGTALLQLLEQRLDNVIFRSGFFNSRDQARQLVSHGHVLVNGKKLSIPSARLHPGDVVTVRDKSKDFILKLQRSSPLPCANWISADQQQISITVNMLPTREMIDQAFKENLLVEFYSR